jgi:hypothetical protein
MLLLVCVALQEQLAAADDQLQQAARDKLQVQLELSQAQVCAHTCVCVCVCVESLTPPQLCHLCHSSTTTRWFRMTEGPGTHP